MSLHTFDTVILTVICKYLKAQDVIHLLQCGNGNLSSKMAQIDLFLDCPLRRFGKFPFLLFTLPRLRRLSVYIDYKLASYPLTLSDALPISSEPVKTLEKLELRFAQSYLAISEVRPLNQIFPNLTVLNLLDSAGLPRLDLFNSLPPQLRELRISPFFIQRAPMNAVLPSEFSKLPRTLEVFHLKESLIGIPFQPVVGDIDWPPNLTDLALCHVADGTILLQLPPKLISIFLITFCTPGAPYDMNKLPKTLKSVDIVSNAGELPFVYRDGSMPPHLERWEATADWSQMTNCSLLPETLAHISDYDFW
jgi:hypothetical protein